MTKGKESREARRRRVQSVIAAVIGLLIIITMLITSLRP
jgi:hypothetical protein